VARVNAPAAVTAPYFEILILWTVLPDLCVRVRALALARREGIHGITLAFFS